MTYFNDLTNYTYSDRPSTGLNIGWLDVEHDFTTGKTSEEFREALYLCCSVFSINRMRGYHDCQFCPEGACRGLQWTKREGHKYPADFGNGEIHIPGIGENSGKLYVAPTLVYHYVVKHQYRPPDEFIQAVLSFTNLMHLEPIVSVDQ